MAVRSFVPWPDQRLQTSAAVVEQVTDDVSHALDDMVDTMNAMPGYGLAAPQIGLMLRLAVVDCSDDRGNAIMLVNPKVVYASDELFEWEEASPNLPGVSAKVKRPASVKVSFLDRKGNPTSQEFNNLWATSVQHQIDHLDGLMYFDRLSRTRRAMILKRAKKVTR